MHLSKDSAQLLFQQYKLVGEAKKLAKNGEHSSRFYKLAEGNAEKHRCLVTKSEGTTFRYGGAISYLSNSQDPSAEDIIWFA